MRTVIISLSIAFLILLIACINYMNLTTARSTHRCREVGIRKVVGAYRSQLARQFFSEAMIYTVLAFILSVFIVIMMLPGFSRFLERNIQLSTVLNFNILIWMIPLVLLVGLLAGSYPALLISAFKPISALRNTHRISSKKDYFRNGLVVFQFIISTILIIGMLVIKRQNHYIRTKDIGYNREKIIVVMVRDTRIIEKSEIIKTDLLKHPNILSASFSSHLPNQMDWALRVHWPGMPDDVDQMMNFAFIDYEFLNVYDIEIVQGRNFLRDFPSDREGAFLLNEKASDVLGWESPLGRAFDHWRFRRGGGFATGKIIGVLKDFHLLSLHNEIEPLYLMLDTAPMNSGFGHLSVKIKADQIPQTVEFLEGQMQMFSPEYPFEFRFFDNIFNSVYRSEVRSEKLFSGFAMLAMIIACLGLFGLASYTAEQRTQEIGIRKVLGASIWGIVILLSKEFIRWVLLANLIAWPVAYLAMDKWLQNFTYKAELSIVLFISAGLFALVIAVFTIGMQAFKAATRNPVDVLKFE